MTSLQYSIDIPSSIQKKHKLDFVRCSSITVFNAAGAMLRKHYGQLEPDKVMKFNLYRNRKLKIGEPLEKEIIYQPNGGTRTCLNCGEFT